MEEEAAKLKKIQNEVSISMTSPSAGSGGAAAANMSYEEKVEVDARSVYVGNVDYGATAEELEQHFHGCGSINRVTILCNKFDGNPKGFAYVEFTDKDCVDTAMALDDSLFRGRQIKVQWNAKGKVRAKFEVFELILGDAEEDQQTRDQFNQSTTTR